MITGYLLRQQAQDDLESIWLYCYHEWGVEQADKYILTLLSRFICLSENCAESLEVNFELGGV